MSIINWNGEAQGEANLRNKGLGENFVLVLLTQNSIIAKDRIKQRAGHSSLGLGKWRNKFAMTTEFWKRSSEQRKMGEYQLSGGIWEAKEGVLKRTKNSTVSAVSQYAFSMIV